MLIMQKSPPCKVLICVIISEVENKFDMCSAAKPFYLTDVNDEVLILLTRNYCEENLEERTCEKNLEERTEEVKEMFGTIGDEANDELIFRLIFQFNPRSNKYPAIFCYHYSLAQNFQVFPFHHFVNNIFETILGFASFDRNLQYKFFYYELATI